VSDLHFITATVCPFAQRSHLALLEKGLDFKHSEINLRDKPAWFEAISPYSKVPVLQRGGNVIYEPAIINQYLEDVYPEPARMPADPGQRAMARIWIDYDNVKFTVAFYRVLLEQDRERRAVLVQSITDMLGVIEDEALGKLGYADGNAGPYFLGSEISLADLSFYPHLERFGVLIEYRGIDMPARFERLRAWLAAMVVRPSVQATSHSADYHVEAYKRYADGSADGTAARYIRAA
jgi:glutathione S-transferase